MTEVLGVITQLIQQVGFPIAVAVWLLWRTDRRLERITDILQQIERTMALIEKSVNGGHD